MCFLFLFSVFLEEGKKNKLLFGFSKLFFGLKLKSTEVHSLIKADSFRPEDIFHPPLN